MWMWSIPKELCKSEMGVFFGESERTRRHLFWTICSVLMFVALVEHHTGAPYVRVDRITAKYSRSLVAKDNVESLAKRGNKEARWPNAMCATRRM